MHAFPNFSSSLKCFPRFFFGCACSAVKIVYCKFFFSWRNFFVYSKKCVTEYFDTWCFQFVFVLREKWPFSIIYSKHKHNTCIMSFDRSQMMTALSSFECENETEDIHLIDTRCTHILLYCILLHCVMSEMEETLPKSQAIGMKFNNKSFQRDQSHHHTHTHTNTLAESFFRQNCLSYPEIQRRKEKKNCVWHVIFGAFENQTFLCQYVRSTIPTKKHIVECNWNWNNWNWKDSRRSESEKTREWTQSYW